MLIRYTLESTIRVPDGSRIIEPEEDEQFCYCVLLPTGERIRVDPYITVNTLAEGGHAVEEIADQEKIDVHDVEGALIECVEIQVANLVSPLMPWHQA